MCVCCVCVFVGVGFEKMDRGLSERYPDKTSPIEWHFNTLSQLGANPELINPQTNRVTSDTVKVSGWVLFLKLHTEEPLYSGHHWDPAGCPV